MREKAPEEITDLLGRWSAGDRDALSRLMPLVYQELRRIARRQMSRERPGHTLQTTALVHETYLNLLGQGRAGWNNRQQFYSVSALLMRRVLHRHLERARARKRGGEWVRVPLDSNLPQARDEPDQLLALDAALDRLQQADPRQAQIAELRIYLGCAIEEIAAQLRVSRSTVQREWRLARAWLSLQLRSSELPRQTAANA